MRAVFTALDDPVYTWRYGMSRPIQNNTAETTAVTHADAFNPVTQTTFSTQGWVMSILAV